jgi:arylsulfatase A-like enzyme
MPDILATSREYNEPIIQFNDYDYESNKFFYKDDATGKKLERYLEYFETQGEIDKSLTKEFAHIDSYTKYPYMPIKLDPRWNMSTGSQLYGPQFQNSEIGQANIMGRYKLSERYTPTYFEGSLAVKALRRLQRQRSVDGRAWFLTASFHSPHPPMVPAWKHLSKYWDSRNELFIPPSLNDPMDNSAYTTITEQLPRYKDPSNIQEWTALYYALIEEVDEYVGKLLDAVANDTMANNTLVIFTSDHGEMLGQVFLMCSECFFFGRE